MYSEIFIAPHGSAQVLRDRENAKGTKKSLFNLIVAFYIRFCLCGVLFLPVKKAD
jgi:hypothetical protein